MPLAGPAITSAILAAGPTLKGPVWGRLAVAVGTAVGAWALVPANLSMQGVTTGVVGTGVVNGKFSVIPAPIPLPASFSGTGLVGFDASVMATAIGLGVANAFNASAAYQGTSAGVGTGTDVSRVLVSNGPSLVTLLNTTAASQGLLGGDMPRLSTAIGTGVATLLTTGTGVGVVTGPGGPAPAGGTSFSRVF